MYSIVLVTALATAATPNWCHRNACHGCSNGCYGGYAGYAGYAGYSGYAGYGCYGCHGCHTPIQGYGAAGGCYGYHGGCYGAFGVVHADAYRGSCYGCHGGHSGYGVPLPVQVVVPAKVPVTDPFPPINPKKDGEEIPKPKEKAKPEEQTRAKIHIEVPEGGKLFVDGKQVNVAAGARVFSTPNLAQGESFFYDVRIEIERNGITRGEEQRVVIQAGQDAFVNFPTLRPAGAFTAQVRP